MTGFREGDRVLIPTRYAGGYLQPYRKMIQAGRIARIEWVRDYQDSWAGRMYLNPPVARIKFEGKFKYARTLSVTLDRLELAVGE